MARAAAAAVAQARRAGRRMIGGSRPAETPGRQLRRDGRLYPASGLLLSLCSLGPLPRLRCAALGHGGCRRAARDERAAAAVCCAVAGQHGRRANHLAPGGDFRGSPGVSTTRCWDGRRRSPSRPHGWTLCQFSAGGIHRPTVRDGEPAAQPRADLEHGAEIRRSSVTQSPLIGLLYRRNMVHQIPHPSGRRQHNTTVMTIDMNHATTPADSRPGAVRLRTSVLRSRLSPCHARRR